MKKPKLEKLLLATTAIVVIIIAVFGVTRLHYMVDAPVSKINAWYPRFGHLFLSIRSFIPKLPFVLLSIIIIFIFLYRHEIFEKLKKYRREISLSFFTTVITLAIAECTLRICGYHPGYISVYHYSEVVDTLIPYQGYLADENAMTYTDPAIARKLHEFLVEKAKEKISSVHISDYPDWQNVAYDLQHLIVDYPPIIAGVDTGEFTRFYIATKNKPFYNDFDSLIFQYVFNPINSYGFRSIEFRKHSAKKRILLIGDSYTFGYTASNRLYSFYDLLLARGYEVYNTGIIGADPPQYLAVAKKFIPLLKPDIVIVNFYLGNDVQYYRQNFGPYQPFFYRTNAGALLSCPFGVKMRDANEAYQFATEDFQIPADASRINALCKKTAITTLAWNLLKNVFHFETRSKNLKEFYKRAEAFRIDYPDANDRIPQIEKLCHDNNSKFVLCIIPCLPGDGGRKLVHTKDDPLLFPHQKYYEASQLVETDYCTGGDTHFNDVGHRKYAAFLQSIIDTLH